MFKIKHFQIKTIFLLMAALLFAFQAEAKIGDSLNISRNQTVVYSGPSQSSSKVMTINSTMQLIEMERLAGWVLVTVKPSGVQGWVREQDLTTAKQPGAEKKLVAKRRPAVISPAAARKALSALGPVRTITLDDMGFRKGQLFKGSQGGHSQNFYFKTPMDSSVRGGVFRLSYRAANMPLTTTNIVIYVNDIPLSRIDVQSDNLLHEHAVVLQRSMFRDGVLKVSIESGTVNENRCLDIRAGGGYLHILPSTALDITYSSIDKSIRDAWRMLPHKVVVSLPAGDLDASQFAASMSVMELLAKAGREIVIKRLPEIGDIVVANKDEIVTELNRRGKLSNRNFVELKTGDVFRTPTDNLNLIRSGNVASIAVSEPYDVQPLYLIDNRWELLAAGRHYDINQPDRFYSTRSLPGKPGSGDNTNNQDLADKVTKVAVEEGSDHYSMPLFQLDTAPHYISRQTSWETTLSPQDLPSGTRLDMLSLSIIAPVRWEADPTYELYVFLNNVLVLSKRLENDGENHNYSVPLPEQYQQQYNNLRFVVQHDIESGDCRGVMPNDFVQITPDTTVIVKVTDSEPTKFSGLAQYFSSGFDTLIAEKYLSDPLNALHLISRVSADLPLLIDYSRIQFVKESEALNPDSPFVAFGNFNLDNLEAPVRMDKGKVEIRDKDGQSFFSVNVLPKITIAQIASASSSYGLLIIPSNLIQHDFNEKLRLIEGDVAFIDTHGVLLHVDSSQPTLAEVYYPDTKDWFAVLGAYRFWLLGLLWFLLSLAIVYLFRLSRRQQSGDDHDVEMPTSEDLHSQRVHHTNINIEDDDINRPNK
jgi:hypothetical protein